MEEFKRIGYKNTVHRSSSIAHSNTPSLLLLQQDGPRIMGEETKIKMGEWVTILIEEQVNLD